MLVCCFSSVVFSTKFLCYCCLQIQLQYVPLKHDLGLIITIRYPAAWLFTSFLHYTARRILNPLLNIPFFLVAFLLFDTNVSTLPQMIETFDYATPVPRQQPGASPEPIEIEGLLALVVPVRASTSWAPEMSPEGQQPSYPSMSEVSSAMWCDYDDEDDDDGGDNDGRDGRMGLPDGTKRRLLRVSVQSLDGHV